MSTPDASQTSNKLDEDACVYALEQLMHGHKPGDIRRNLVASGHSQKQADQIVQYALNFRKSNQEDGLAPSENQQRGKRNMMIGGGFFLLGLAITFGSIAVVSSRGSGSIYLAGGAIVWGAVQFFRGVVQSKS